MTFGGQTARILALALALGLSACNQGEEQGAQDSSYVTRTNSGEISFQLTPRGLVDGRFVVDLRANTHSGDLSELDLANIVTLTVGGEPHRPAEATQLSGHHSGGSLAFDLDAAPQQFAIVVQGARQMGELKFQWP